MLQSSKGAVIPFGSPLIFIMFVVNYKAIHGLGKKEEGGGGRGKGGGWAGSPCIGLYNVHCVTR